MRAIFFFALASFASAQTPAANVQTSTDTQAASTIQRAVSAQFGSTSIQDVQLSGKVVMHSGIDVSGSVLLVADSSGRSKVTFTLPSGSRSEYLSGHTENPACTWTDANGKTQDIAAHNCRTNGALFLPALALTTAFNSGKVAFSYKGSTASDAGTVDHLASSKTVAKTNITTTALIQKLSTDDLSLDTTTALPSSLKFFIHPDDDAKIDIPVEIRYSDYREVRGVKIPFRIEKLVHGSSFLEITVDSATFNNGPVAASSEVTR